MGDGRGGCGEIEGPSPRARSVELASRREATTAGKPAQSRYADASHEQADHHRPPRPTCTWGRSPASRRAIGTLKRALGYANWHAQPPVRLPAGRARPHRRRPRHAGARPHRRHRRPHQHRPAAGAHQCARLAARALGAPRRGERHSRQPRHLFAARRRSRHRALGGLHDLGRARGRARRARRGFPFVRMLGGGVALIGVNSAVPTPPLVASGRVGAAQLARLAAVLERLGAARALPPGADPPSAAAGPGQALRAELADAAALEAVLARHGAELVIHGHNHHQHAGLVRHSVERAAAGGRRAVGVARTAAQARAARSLQSLPHRGGRPGASS